MAGGQNAGGLIAKTPMDARIAEAIETSVAGMGFALVRVRVGGGRRPTVQIMAERADGTMTVEDCAALSRQLSAVLDVADPIEQEYTLEVSSPGVDRPLTRLADFARFVGHEARLETREPVDGRKRFRGVIARVDAAGGEIGVLVEGLGETAVAFAALADAKLVMTDALIAESLRAGDARAALADGAEVALDGPPPAAAEDPDHDPERDAAGVASRN